MRLIWTTAGYAALVNAENDGTNAVRVDRVALGDGSTPAQAADTTLENEHTRLDTIAGQAVADNIIHVTVRDESDAAYTVREFGLIADDGTLLARFAQAEPVIEKAAASTLLLPIDATLTDVDATQIVFGDLSFSNPPWSETVQGVVERASQTEAEAGNDNQRGMSPRRVFDAIKSYFGGATGPGENGALDADTVDGEHAEDLHAANRLTGTVPTARLNGSYNIDISGNAATADRADNADDANNADKLDGQPGSYYHNAANLTGTVPDARLQPSNVLQFAAVAKGQLITATDIDRLGTNSANSLTAPGMYRLGQNTANAPFYASYGNLLVVRDPLSDTLAQVVFDFHSNNIGWRSTNQIDSNDEIDTNGTGPWNTLWHNNNDGAGSGLDADTLDGAELSQIQQMIADAKAEAKREMRLPVGSVYEQFEVDTDPAQLLGYGTWTRLGLGRVTLGIDNDGKYSQNEYDGDERVTLDYDEMPRHSHRVFANEDSSNPIDNNDDATASTGRNDSGPRDYRIGETSSPPESGKTSLSGGNLSHNNMMPYVTVYRWRRTA